jgi:hypothetical protein
MAHAPNPMVVMCKSLLPSRRVCMEIPQIIFTAEDAEIAERSGVQMQNLSWFSLCVLRVLCGENSSAFPVLKIVG